MTTLLSGEWVVTATRRQAREIAEGYARQRVANGDRSWPTPPVWSFEAWLRQSYANAWLTGRSDNRLLLNGAQERALWEQCVDNDAGATVGATRRHSLAQLAVRSWTLAQAWELPLASLRRSASPQPRTFARWAQSFQAHCDQSRWLDSGRLVATVATAIRNEHLDLPKAITLYGFESLTPAQANLVEVLNGANCRTRIARATEPTGTVVRLGLPDPGSEAVAAATWARQILDTQPPARIGIVVADLGARRDEIERVFSDVLEPAAVLPGGRATHHEGVFHISLGQAGDRHPLVAHALLALRFVASGLDYREASRLLCSPFLTGGFSRADARAAMDLELRRRGLRFVTTANIVRLARQHDDPLAKILSSLPSGAGKRLPSDWVSLFSEQLVRLGWPGERSADTTEYQWREFWFEKIDEFASLDIVVGKVDMRTALERLTRLFSASIFQVRDIGARVEIVGSHEAAGLQFDHLWVMGMHDEAWPAQPRPDPFIPLALQRDLAMPSASVEVELKHARWLVASYLASAPNVVLSWPERADDRELAASPLIEHLPISTQKVVSETTSYRRQQFEERPELQILRWDPPPGIGAATVRRNGVRLLTDQAQCPFRAFAAHRLDASIPEVPSLGIDPRTRGIALHAAMEAIWTELGGSDGLAARTDPELQELVGHHVEQALRRTVGNTGSAARRKHVAAEATRLRDLIMASLAIERQRKPFRVARLEADDQVTIGGLQFTVKLDRVDELDDGELTVLDFKTGQAPLAAWSGERLRDAQLPVYAVSRDAPPAGVATIIVRAGEVRFRGVGVTRDLLGAAPKLRLAEADSKLFNGWHELLGAWREQLETLAADFSRGVAAVEPDRDACRYCHLETLCRINEHRRETRAT